MSFIQMLRSTQSYSIVSNSFFMISNMVLNVLPSLWYRMSREGGIRFVSWILYHLRVIL